MKGSINFLAAPAPFAKQILPLLDGHRTVGQTSPESLDPWDFLAYFSRSEILCRK
jgi:hypothetical protein